MKLNRDYYLASFLLSAILLAGCGDKQSVDLPPPPPPAGAPADVSVTPPQSEVLAPPAPGAEAPPPTGTGASIPASQETAPQDMFKGMSQRDIDEFKATATPETHDLNLGSLMEAITGYHAEYSRYPSSQEELVKARYLQKVLFAPKGKKYVINSQTGEITVQ